jgi:hypothetical protein
LPEKSGKKQAFRSSAFAPFASRKLNSCLFWRTPLALLQSLLRFSIQNFTVYSNLYFLSRQKKDF